MNPLGHMKFGMKIDHEQHAHSVGFEVLTAVVMKSSIFWDKTPCSPLKPIRCFGGTRRLHLQGRRISHARNHHEAGTKQSKLHAGLFDPEDGNIFLRNVGYFPTGYTDLYSRRQESSSYTAYDILFANQQTWRRCEFLKLYPTTLKQMESVLSNKSFTGIK
jgi:hypothetical protein